jgi:hypothetical protein
MVFGRCSAVVLRVCLPTEIGGTTPGGDMTCDGRLD